MPKKRNVIPEIPDPTNRLRGLFAAMRCALAEFHEHCEAAEQEVEKLRDVLCASVGCSCSPSVELRQLVDHEMKHWDVAGPIRYRHETLTQMKSKPKKGKKTNGNPTR
jgi:uncharacterized protein YeaO (DUF488 family)